MAIRGGKKKRFVVATVAAAFVAGVLVMPLWFSGAPEAAPEAATPLQGQDAAAKQTAQTGSAADEPTFDVASEPDEGGAIGEHEAGVVLVELPDGLSADELNAALAREDCLAAPYVTQDDVELGWASLPLAADADVQAAARRLEEDGLAESAQPNYVYRLEAGEGRLSAGALSISNADWESGHLIVPTVNDPKANNQWMLEATNADDAYQYAVNDEDGPHVSDDAAQRPAVAVIDTGCYLRHVDLADNIVDWYDAVNDVARGSGFYDVDTGAHGTHVCGITSARTDNGIGVAGVGGNAGLVPIRVFKYDSRGNLGASSLDILRAYNYVLAHAKADRIKVVNMSLGSDLDQYGLDSDDRAVLNAVDKASRAGILTVASAGNSGYWSAYSDFPTSVAETGIGVIAGCITSAQLDVGRSYYSNYNKAGVKTQQLTAPGCDILSTNDGWSTSRSICSSYVRMSGTSMASPCIAGIAALVWAANPDLTVDEMKSVLFSTAQDIAVKSEDDQEQNRYAEGFDLMTGFGCVDALAAVKECDFYLAGVTSTAPGVSVALSPSAAARAAAGAWKWTSSDPAVASVSGGKVTGKKAGATVITATATRTDGEPLKLMQVVTVHGNTLSGASSIYIGKSTTCKVKETRADNGTWTWTTSNSAVASVGKTTGRVVGKKAGKATITATLTTNPAVKVKRTVQVKADIRKATISLSATSYRFDGKAKRPAVTVKLNGKKLAKSCYTVTYSSNVRVGTAKVKVTGKGNYAGSVTKTFRIRR